MSILHRRQYSVQDAFAGRPVSDVLTASDRAVVLEHAHRDGYLLLRRKRSVIALTLAWRARCWRNNHPYVHVLFRRRSAIVLFDLNTTDRDLSSAGHEAVWALFNSAGLRKGGCGPDVGHAEVPPADAEPLARQLLDILQQDLARQRSQTSTSGLWANDP